MSRTYSTRPEWVKLNDPKFPTKERHQHYTVKCEKIGEKETPLFPWRSELPTMYTTRPVYRRWVEAVSCTIDIPEMSWREERLYRLSNNLEKLCDKRPLYRDSYPCCSRAYAKKLSAKAQRASINQQLHNAVRDYGWTTDPDEWYDIDITPGASEDWKCWD